MYEKEKKKKEILKKKINKYKSDIQKADQENRDINIEKDQTIIHIKNSFMSKSSILTIIEKMEEVQNEVELMKQRQNEKSVSYKKIKHEYK